MKLNDTQLVLLSRAAQRDHGGLEVNEGDESQTRAIRTLLRRKLIQAVPRAADLPIWRTGEDGSAQCLVITPSGLAAVGVNESPEEGAESAGVGSKAAATGKVRRASVVKRHARTGAEAERSKLQSGNKTAKVMTLLKRTKGASVAEIMRITGWQPHSVRAALTGLRKKGIAVTRSAPGIYRIEVRS